MMKFKFAFLLDLRNKTPKIMTQNLKSLIYFSALVVTCVIYSYTDNVESNQDNFGAIENQSIQETNMVSTNAEGYNLK